MDAFLPGEELDNGVAQELQPLVVIDPRVAGGGGTRGDLRLDEEAAGKIREYQQLVLD